jgi:hypothetical protein
VSALLHIALILPAAILREATQYLELVKPREQWATVPLRLVEVLSGRGHLTPLSHRTISLQDKQKQSKKSHNHLRSSLCRVS